jgi:ArsR family transcriptional regulator
MDDFLSVCGALSDKNRVRALMALRSGELCVCQIIELLGLAPSTVSKHMSILKQAGLVECRKKERWMYYRLPAAQERSCLVQGALECAIKTLEKCETVLSDRVRLHTITRQNPSRLCKNQRSR